MRQVIFLPPTNQRVCRNAKFRHALLSCVRVSKMQGAEIEDEGSVLTYMTKSEIEEQRSSLLIMTQRLYWICPQFVRNKKILG